MKQTIRIIGGQFRGKKIHFPALETLRPTPDRVRETLFNWLMHDIQEAQCLDAFAGSGGLGFEAFSRGAHVTLLEKNQMAYNALQKIARTFQSSKLHVIKKDALQFLQETPLSFDIIFLDPPYSSNLLQQAITIIETTNALKIGGLIYVESNSDISLPEAGWQMLKLKKAGLVRFGLYKKINTA